MYSVYVGVYVLSCIVMCMFTVCVHVVYVCICLLNGSGDTFWVLPDLQSLVHIM